MSNSLNRKCGSVGGPHDTRNVLTHQREIIRANKEQRITVIHTCCVETLAFVMKQEPIGSLKAASYDISSVLPCP